MGRVTSTRSRRSPGTVPYRARPRRMALRAKSTAQTRCPCSASQAAVLPMPQPRSTTEAPGSIQPVLARCLHLLAGSIDEPGRPRRLRPPLALPAEPPAHAVDDPLEGVHSRDSTVDTPGTSASVSRRSSARGRSFTRARVVRVTPGLRGASPAAAIGASRPRRAALPPPAPHAPESAVSSVSRYVDKSSHSFARWALASLALVLAACSGGDGDDRAEPRRTEPDHGCAGDDGAAGVDRPRPPHPRRVAARHPPPAPREHRRRLRRDHAITDRELPLADREPRSSVISELYVPGTSGITTHWMRTRSELVERHGGAADDGLPCS